MNTTKYWGVPTIAVAMVVCAWLAVHLPQLLALVWVALAYLMLRRYFAASTILWGAILGLLIEVSFVLAVPSTRHRMSTFLHENCAVQQDSGPQILGVNR